MKESKPIAPEHTAVRVALWRALHLKYDAPPHVFNDTIGAEIVGEENWMNRPDMEAAFSKSMRASIVGRARLIEDLVEEKLKQGVDQYVILGAGLDTFAQRRTDLVSKMHVFEVDQPEPQIWKQRRLEELGYIAPSTLHFVPVDFEAGESWWEALRSHGFDLGRSAIVVSTGVSMYLSQEANRATLQQLATLAPGSTFAMTFMLALDLLEGQERAVMEYVMKKAAESGTPFKSLFAPAEILQMAQAAGFKKAEYISAKDIYDRYFARREDGLSAGSAECFLLAGT